MAISKFSELGFNVASEVLERISSFIKKEICGPASKENPSAI